MTVRRKPPRDKRRPIEDAATRESAEDARDLALARRRLAAWEKGGRNGIPLDEIKRALGITRRG